MTNAEKIEWLRGYRMAKLEVQRIQEELERWRSIAEKVTPALTGVRYRTADGSRIETAVEKLQEHRGQLADAVSALIDRCHAVETAISTVPDERLRLLLRYRYIDGLTFERITDKLALSRQWVYELHNCAIEQIKIFVT